MRRCVRSGRIFAAVLATGLLVAVPAAVGASAAPTVITGAAGTLTANGAQLSATVNPNGESTTYAFQYGTTTNYGSTTTTTSAGSGTSAVTVHATVGGLQSGTTYHYRVVATNTTGSSPGSDMSFTTSALAPSASTASPSLVTSDTARLVGSVNPNGHATTYSFQYGPTAGYGLQSPATSAGSGSSNVTVRASLSGLETGTTYHYRLVATSADGSTASPDATFTTSGDHASPSGTLPVVSGTSAANITTSAAQLNGAVNPEGPTTQWYFQYGLSSFYGTQTSPQTLSGTGARPVQAELSGLQSGTTYHFRLVAVSANGLYVGVDHTFSTSSASRDRATLYLHASARRRSGYVAVAVSGTLGLPSGVGASSGCQGTVAVQIVHGGSTLVVRRMPVQANCTYRMTVYVANRRVRHATRLTVFDRFEGNQTLLPATAFHYVRL